MRGSFAVSFAPQHGPGAMVPAAGEEKPAADAKSDRSGNELN
jgi:hypothetical protein